MDQRIIIQHGSLYLSTKFLCGFLSKRTVEKWVEVEQIEQNDRVFFLYDSIPPRSKEKLPSAEKIISKENSSIVYILLKKLIDEAFFYGFEKYKEKYMAYSELTEEKASQASKLHAVIEVINAARTEHRIKDLITVYEVFNTYFPNKYKSKHAISNALRKAAADGIESIALDKRYFGNNTGRTLAESGIVTRYWMSVLVAQPTKLSNGDVLKLISNACDKFRYPVPSLSWVKKYRRESLANLQLYKSRYGTIEANKLLPYATLQHAEYSNNQWQLDGWTMPFWFQGEKKFCRAVLVRLIDNKSKKIVGFSIGKSEDTFTIMDAIRDAINTQEAIPFEILTDNHSFNKTNEAKNIIHLLQKKGARWTVTHNPQYKAIIERYNQHLDKLCKPFYGYLGQGIRSKGIDAITNPELTDKYVSNQLSFDEVRAIGIHVVKQYNEILNKQGLSPNDIYAQTKHPYSISVNLFDRAELLTFETTKLVRRGQITFTKGLAKYEYQFPAALFSKYNNKDVLVRYEDLAEGIYVFDAKTKVAIDFLKLKSQARGTQADQEEEDREILNRNRGRLRGIVSRDTKELEDIRDKALAIDPNAYDIMNQLLVHKEAKAEYEQDAALQQYAASKGFDPKTLPQPRKSIVSIPAALLPPKKDKNPFNVSGNKIELLNPNNEELDGED